MWPEVPISLSCKVFDNPQQERTQRFLSRVMATNRGPVKEGDTIFVSALWVA